MAMTLTYPEMVNRANIGRLRRRIEAGPDAHPGANFIRKADGYTKSLLYGKRKGRRHGHHSVRSLLRGWVGPYI